MGTTAIQANDLVGRKTVRDGGATAQSLISAMRATVAELNSQDNAALSRIATRLEASVQDYEAVVSYIVDNAKDNPRAVYAGSVPYLMLAGLAHGGWQMARAALVCTREGADGVFERNKLLTARFYADHLLPRTHALRLAVVEGSQSVALPEQ